MYGTYCDISNICLFKGSTILIDHIAITPKKGVANPVAFIIGDDAIAGDEIGGSSGGFMFDPSSAISVTTLGIIYDCCLCNSFEGLYLIKYRSTRVLRS